MPVIYQYNLFLKTQYQHVQSWNSIPATFTRYNLSRNRWEFSVRTRNKFNCNPPRIVLTHQIAFLYLPTYIYCRTIDLRFLSSGTNAATSAALTEPVDRSWEIFLSAQNLAWELERKFWNVFDSTEQCRYKIEFVNCHVIRRFNYEHLITNIIVEEKWKPVIIKHKSYATLFPLNSRFLFLSILSSSNIFYEYKNRHIIAFVLWKLKKSLLRRLWINNIAESSS